MKQRGMIDIALTLILAGVAALLVLAAWLASAEEDEWGAFSAQHHCKVFVHVRGQSITTINSDGKMGVGSTSDQTGYLCDNGVTYYR